MYKYSLWDVVFEWKRLFIQTDNIKFSSLNDEILNKNTFSQQLIL